MSGCTMSWMGGLGWKEGLSGVQMQKVEELEKSLADEAAGLDDLDA